MYKANSCTINHIQATAGIVTIVTFIQIILWNSLNKDTRLPTGNERGH